MDSHTNLIYLRATRKDIQSLKREISKIPAEKVTQHLSEAMFKAVIKSINAAEFQETIEILLHHGADINYVYSNSTVLLNILATKMWPAAEWILDQKPNLSIRDGSNRNCLHVIIEYLRKDTRVLKLMARLIKEGVNPLDEDRNGDTPLHKACEKLWLEAIQLLVKAKGAVFHQNSATLDTPLHVAARQRGLEAIECAKELLDAGAYVKMYNKAQKSPLDDAITKGNAEMKELLEKKMIEQDYVQQQVFSMYCNYPHIYDGMGQPIYSQPQPYPLLYPGLQDAFFGQSLYQRTLR
eukprot:TRINITY_DN920_c0_g1_i5.p1 TRINITY_DN920_c0_g1~~TRINITY_DN920_c0_g1_i5.p1  ORF type:complete len:295 (-),score=104.32 TRINITY_DN920_c0_g1_i5:586-1470(-)